MNAHTTRVIDISIMDNVIVKIYINNASGSLNVYENISLMAVHLH